MCSQRTDFIVVKNLIHSINTYQTPVTCRKLCWGLRTYLWAWMTRSLLLHGTQRCTCETAAHMRNSHGEENRVMRWKVLGGATLGRTVRKGLWEEVAFVQRPKRGALHVRKQPTRQVSARAKALRWEQA